MSTFLAGLAAAAVLTAVTIVAYDFAQVTTPESLSLPSVHVDVPAERSGVGPVQARND